MPVVPFSPPFRKATLTQFERDLLIAFNIHKGDPRLGYLCVTLDYNAESPHSFKIAKSGLEIPAVYMFLPLDKEDDPLHAAEILSGYIQMPQQVVMMLDLHGAPLEEQIPGWAPGTIEFPDRFVENPVMNVPLPEQKEMTNIEKRFFRVEINPKPSTP